MRPLTYKFDRVIEDNSNKWYRTVGGRIFIINPFTVNKNQSIISINYQFSVEIKTLIEPVKLYP